MAFPKGFAKLVVLSAIYLIQIANAGPDNQGKEFIIGYMENNGVTFDAELFVTTMRPSSVSVSVTAPLYGGINEQFTVKAGEVKRLLFSSGIRMTGSVKSNKGVLVSASDEVVIYGVNKETYSCDAFLGLPTDVLGMEYYVVAYYPPSKQAEMLVVGVQDSTTVTIKFGPSLSSSKPVTYNNIAYSQGDTLTVTVNKYETLQLTCLGELTGTYITSDKPVSVFSGNKKTNIGSGGSSDHLVEQMTPVSTWGKNFLTAPIPLRTTGDYFRFVASEDSTTIVISGGHSETFTLSSKGDFVEKDIASTAFCKITSDKPILVVQFCLSQQNSNEKSDPMMMIIPPVEQYAADYTFATPKYSKGSYTNYFMFVVKKVEKDGLRLDGDAFPSATVYNDIGSDYYGGYIIVSEGSHTVKHTSSISIFGGYLYGQALYETYGFTTGMRMAPINTVCVASQTTPGDGIDNDCDGLIDEELCFNSNDDDGDGSDDEDCAAPPPIDGMWTPFSAYGACSLTCKPYGSNTNGIRTRTRTCTDPAPQYNGMDCVGSATEDEPCTTSVICPINGNWGAWAAWGSCSVTCATGVKSRARVCDDPAPNYGGDDCVGSSTEETACTMVNCPIDGAWVDWPAWSTCTVTCGGGTQNRDRTCTNPPPQYNGADCVGAPSATQDCNTAVCIIDGAWGAWGSYGACTRNCGGGKQARPRSCDNPIPQNGGLPCPGDSSELQDCNTSPCPTNTPQSCPTGFWACATGSISCIETSFVCDCSSDCDDGSDETSYYANCTTAFVQACENRGNGADSVLRMPLVTLLLLAILGIAMNIFV